MAGRDGSVRIMQKVRPLLSVGKEDSKRRVLGLYKAWSRQIPFIGKVKSPHFFKNALKNK